MLWNVWLSCLWLIPLVFAQYSPTPRWGQATVLMDSLLYVHGGLSDPYNSYSYTSAPTTPDVLSLDLATSFDASAPPWNLLSATFSPGLAWHTLSALNTTHILLFGGQPGPNSQTVLSTLNDSAILLEVSNRTDPTFTIEAQNWAREPMRRMRHAASSSDGKVWIIGGEKADGSGNAFSEHYIFNPSSTEFIPLSLGYYSPPDIYGHASLVLPDERLVVLGGYCASCAELVPLSSVWVANTIKNVPDWELLPVSSSSLPAPRRNFASVVLPNGNILIHGGGDADLQETYSDGWILDTSATPMTWQSIETLSQVGKRKDHAAIQAGGLVLFCFGYGASAPASAFMLIFDPTTLDMVSSYTAPSPSSTAVLPGSTQTGDSGSTSNSGSTGTMSGNAPSGIDPPSDPSGPNSDTSNSTTLAIALGTTFGFLGVLTGTMIVYYAKRAHDQKVSGKFVLLGGELEDKTGDGGSAIPVTGSHYAVRRMDWLGAGSLAGVLTFLGIRSSRRDHRQPRRDMFADEDVRSFTWGSPLGVSRREGSDVTSAWSLRSMGAIVRSVMSREPSASGTGSNRENRLTRIGEGDRQELMVNTKRRSQGPGRRDSGWMYVDPFADPPPEDDYPGLDLRQGALERDDEYDRPISHDMPLDDYDLTFAPPLTTTSPITFPLRTLSPLKEITHTSSSNLPSPPHSLLDIFQDKIAVSPSDPMSSTSPTAAHTPYIPSLEAPHRSSLSILYSPPSQPIRRSDSWWARFAKTPLLDRRGTASSISNKLLDFRDPAPAPPLSIIEENSIRKTSPTEPTFKADVHGDIPIDRKHTRSISSAHSMRTADTESVERLGGSYDVVQRVLSEATLSRHTLASSIVETQDTSDIRRSKKLLAVNRLSIATGEESILSCSSSVEHSLLSFPSQTLVSTDSPKTSTTAVNTRSQSPLATMTSPAIQEQALSSLPMVKEGSMVANKVRVYERRLSQDLESQLPSPPRNTRKYEEVPSRSRPTIKYGLAPRASLYIANPDLSSEGVL
ncbi:hypothetical protein V8B97DRAFT_1958378 [Scleroderma yunnanense]